MQCVVRVLRATQVRPPLHAATMTHDNCTTTLHARHFHNTQLLLVTQDRHNLIKNVSGKVINVEH